MQVWLSLGCSPEYCVPGCGRADCDDVERSRVRRRGFPQRQDAKAREDALIKAERTERMRHEQQEKMRAEERELERRKLARREAEERKQKEIERMSFEEDEQARKREKERLAEELRLQAEFSSKEAARVSRIEEAVKDMVEGVDESRAQRLQAWLKANRFKGVNAKRSKWLVRFFYPLHHAVRRKDAEIVELLLANDADASLKDSSKRTPLMLAQTLHDKKGEYAQVLTALGAPP
mmetsp:Transcript_16945/g.30670  ORF Transcript_16945/g.30670 Transcript_16945/m.30670 type:complete len:235 (+) Transcript_16945:108-812(+)